MKWTPVDRLTIEKKAVSPSDFCISPKDNSFQMVRLIHHFCHFHSTHVAFAMSLFLSHLLIHQLKIENILCRDLINLMTMDFIHKKCIICIPNIKWSLYTHFVWKKNECGKIENWYYRALMKGYISFQTFQLGSDFWLLDLPFGWGKNNHIINTEMCGDCISFL